VQYGDRNRLIAPGARLGFARAVPLLRYDNGGYGNFLRRVLAEIVVSQSTLVQRMRFADGV
jgi:hypothetical protein